MPYNNLLKINIYKNKILINKSFRMIIATRPTKMSQGWTKSNIKIKSNSNKTMKIQIIKKSKILLTRFQIM